MSPNEPLVFGQMVKRRISGVQAMVVEPKIKRNDAGGGWFSAIAITERPPWPALRNRVGEIAYYQRAQCEKIE